MSCPICHEIFKSNNNIYSTTCGHVFHFHCMEQWQRHSPDCPQCRHCGPQTHKIFLNLEELEKTQNEVQAKLDENKQKTTTVLHKLQQSYKRNQELQEELNKTEEQTKELESKVSQLTTENESQRQELVTQKADMDNLLNAMSTKKGGDDDMPNIAEIILSEKNKVLEEKLKQISKELANEIKNSTELSVDKMKIQNLLTQQFAVNPQKTLGASNRAGDMKRTAESTHRRCSNVAREHYVPRINLASNMADNLEQQSKKTITTVVIMGLKDMHMNSDLIDVVLKLAEKLEVSCTKDDIENVHILERNNNTTRADMYPDVYTLVVKFKNLDKKIQFLSNKRKLQQNADTRKITMYEYVSDDIIPLFHHAKILKSFGYSKVFCKNNIVFVRKNDNSPAIRIYHKRQVDELMKALGTMFKYSCVDLRRC